MAKGNEKVNEAIEFELDGAKRLLALLLLKTGALQGEIAMALGVSQSKLSKMIPARKVKKFKFLISPPPVQKRSKNE